MKSQFAVCIGNEEYPVSLELRKIYQVIPDVYAEEHHLIRVVDESGEDYLYPANFFVLIELPQIVEEIFVQAG